MDVDVVRLLTRTKVFAKNSTSPIPPHFSFITPLLPFSVITLNEVNKALFERIDDLWQEAQRMVKSSGNSQEYPALSCKDIKLNNKFARNDT